MENISGSSVSDDPRDAFVRTIDRRATLPPEVDILIVCAAIGALIFGFSVCTKPEPGLALLFTRLWPGVEGNLAHAHHVIGSLVLTVVSVAAAEVARPARWLNLLLGAGLMALSVRRGPIRERYGAWDSVINS